MKNTIMTKLQRWHADGVSRRELFRTGGILGALGLAGGAAGQQARGLSIAPDIYQSIGVRPLINCRGTLTLLSGSLTLPEVKRAMDEASRHFVHLDELAEAVGKRLAEITKAEWGLVTAGCAAGMAHTTAACVAGADPEKLKRLPNLAGLKNEVVIPSYARNVYDHGVRMTGVKVVTVARKEDFAAAFTPQTAMVYLTSGAQSAGPYGLPFVAEVAHSKGVPVFVDAAAEDLTIPNEHLKKGADLVGYSGGKTLRGPQCAGLVLGNKNILQAAWIASAPHHGFGRALKVGKEEMIGMLAAVETWAKTDHAAEYKQRQGYLEFIAARLSKIPGVTTSIREPNSLSNHAPTMIIQWDPAKFGLTGAQMDTLLDEGNPRIITFGSDSRTDPVTGTVTIGSHMMMPGEEKIFADRTFAILSNPPKLYTPKQTVAPTVTIGGRWDVHIEYLRGISEHSLMLEQQGGKLVGAHHGEFLSGDLQGSVEGNQISMSSTHRYEGTGVGYSFTGSVSNDAMQGVLSVGEYGQAKWTARRHQYVQGGRRPAG